jgi:hypothetical protein
MFVYLLAGSKRANALLPRTLAFLARREPETVVAGFF